MTKSETAAHYFNGGFNCAAAVISGFCEDYDLDTELAVKLACGLGGGFGTGEICGAASAAVLVVGLKYGQNIHGDVGTKMNCYAKTTQLLDAFKEKYGAITCRDLLSSLAELEEDEAMSERRRLCTGYVKDAVEILEELGY